MGQSQSAAGFQPAPTTNVTGLWGIPAEVLPESCLLVVVGGKERLGVRIGVTAVAPAFQVASQFPLVVDFTVEADVQPVSSDGAAAISQGRARR
mgnify:CR=1 FL=1